MSVNGERRTESVEADGWEERVGRQRSDTWDPPEVTIVFYEVTEGVAGPLKRPFHYFPKDIVVGVREIR